jgi:hypothetical protein
MYALTSSVYVHRRYVRNLEKGYTAIWENFLAGDAPTHVLVDDGASKATLVHDSDPAGSDALYPDDEEVAAEVADQVSYTNEHVQRWQRPPSEQPQRRGLASSARMDRLKKRRGVATTDDIGDDDERSESTNSNTDTTTTAEQDGKRSKKQNRRSQKSKLKKRKSSKRNSDAQAAKKKSRKSKNSTRRSDDVPLKSNKKKRKSGRRGKVTSDANSEL